MSVIKLRESMVAYRVLVALYKAEGHQMNVLDLIVALNTVEPMKPTKLTHRCWNILGENMVAIIGSQWMLMSAGVAEVESRGGVGTPLVAEWVGVAAAPRTIQKSMASKVLSTKGMYASVRPDGLTFKSEPSLMGATRKLPSGDILV